MSAIFRLVVVMVLVSAATGCGTGFVNGWREEKEPTGTPAERCERREGYSWVGSECKKDSGLDLGDVTAEEQCKQIENAGWFNNTCVAYEKLNAEQCATIDAWGWLDGKCRTDAEIACLAVEGKTYLNGQCLDRPVLTTDGDLQQSIVAGFAIEPISMLPAPGSTVSISSQTCKGFFKIAANKLESSNGTELDPNVKKCEATVVASSQLATSEPVKVLVTIQAGFLRICDEDRRNNTVRLLMNVLDATDCADGAAELAKWEKPIVATGALLEDLRPFAGLRNLKKLVFDNNRIKDVKALSGLTGLEYLDITDNDVDDLRPLANLTQLGIVYAAGNPLVGGDPAKCPKDAKSPGVAAFCAQIQGP